MSDKPTGEMETALNKRDLTDHKYGIGISSISDTVFRYLPIFLTVLRYWVSPMPSPPPPPPSPRLKHKG